MKKNGFTLVEVIAVVAILAILAILLIPKMNTTIKNNKLKACEAIKINILDAAEEYSYSHVNEIDSSINSNGYANVTLLSLMQEGLLEAHIKNPFTDEEISTSEVVKITKVGYVYNFEYTGGDCS